MNAHYYSQLDLINKYQLLNLNESKDVIQGVEVCLTKLEKEEIEGKDTELETLTFFNSLFSRSPKIIVKNSYISGKFSKEINKKIKIHNKNSVSEMLNFIVSQCHTSNRSLKVVNQKRGCFFLLYQIKLRYKKHSLQMPTALLRRSGSEIPNIKFKIFFNKTNIKNYMDIYPLWQLPDLNSIS